MEFPNMIRLFIACSLLHISTATITNLNTNDTGTTDNSNGLVKLNSTGGEEKNTLFDDVFPAIREHIGNARTFSENTQLTANEAYYIGGLLVVNTLVLLGVMFWLWTPQLRFCSLFGNCDSTAGEYPAGVGHNLQDPRMMNTYYNTYPTASSYARTLQKRSLEYVGPILKTLAAAYDQYDRDVKRD